MDKEKLNDIICESSSDYDILNDAYNYIANLEQQCKKQKEVINKAIKFIVKETKSMPTNGCKIRLTELLDILKEASICDEYEEVSE